MTEPASVKQVIRVTRRLLQELGREPTYREIGDEIGINADKVQEIIDDARGVRKCADDGHLSRCDVLGDTDVQSIRVMPLQGG